MTSGDHSQLINAICHDPQQAELVGHILATWLQRKIVNARHTVTAEIAAASPGSIEHIELCANRDLDEAIRGDLVIDRAISWWWIPIDRWASTEPDYSAMRPIQGAVVNHARKMGHSLLAVQAQAVVLPPLPLPYPLDDRLGRIDDLAGSADQR